MTKWIKFKRFISIITLSRYHKYLPFGGQSRVYLRVHRWWNEQLTTIGKPIFTIWFLFCITAPFQYGKPSFYICVALGSFNFFNYMIAYVLIHLKVDITRNHTLSAHAGSPIYGHIGLNNLGYSTLKDIEVFERVLPIGITQPDIPFISDVKKKGSVNIPFQLMTNHRGEYQLKSIIVATSYPFGIIRKIKIKKSPQKIIVYPQLLPIELPKLNHSNSSSQNQRARIFDAAQNEYVGNREYTFGDQYNSIDHKAWGRVGYPVTKVYQNDFEDNVGVFFLPQYQNYYDEENFENAIKVTASILKNLIDQKLSTAYLDVTEKATEIINEIQEPDKIFERLALIKSINIKGEILWPAFTEFSNLSNRIYMIGTEQILLYLERLIKITPIDTKVSIFICSNELSKPLPPLPSHYQCTILNDEILKSENISIE